MPLLRDESLTSWLVRAAIVQGCDPLDLTGYLWPRWRAWIRDLDRGLGLDKLRPLSKTSGINEMAFDSASLRPIAELIAGMPLTERAVWPWMLALGSRNRKRHGGIQYCPACFAKDATPYYRLQWRFAWHTICATHKSMLLDRCPHCLHPVEPHRLTAEDKHSAVCATCKIDLRNANASGLNEHALGLQQAADLAIASRSARFNESAVSTSDWFALMRWYANVIRGATLFPSGKLARFICCIGGNIEGISPPSTGLAIEVLPISERTVLLAAVQDVLATSPDRLLEAANEAELPAMTFRQSHMALPACLERIATQLPKKAMSKRHRHLVTTPQIATPSAVRRKWALLQRKMLVDLK